MIRAFVNYSLGNKLLVLVLAAILIGWGAIAFKNLPVEAYPDVANNYVQVITQWAGRAGEEVEQQVTIPIEVQMAGIPHLATIRSISEFGLSVVTMSFDDESQNDWNRQKVLERLSLVTLPNGLQPSIGPDFSPVGQLYWYTLEFGVVREGDAVKVYGAGLLSSFGELGRFEREEELQPWNVDAIADTEYDPTHYQKKLFVAPSFDIMQRDVTAWLERAR